MIGKQERRVIAIEPRYLDRIMEIERVSFKDPWPKVAFLAELKHPWSWFLGIGIPGRDGLLKKLEAFTVCWMLPGDLHLLNLAVDPACRRKGIGGRLLHHVILCFAKQGGGVVSLEVRESNTAAQRLYQSFGFLVVGRRPGYYRRDNEDAILMNLDVLPVEEREIHHAGS